MLFFLNYWDICGIIALSLINEIQGMELFLTYEELKQAYEEAMQKFSEQWYQVKYCKG